MTTKYNDVPGWGNFGTIHTNVLSNIPEGSTVVELGVAFGRGIATLVEMSRNLNKKFRIVGIDNFQGESKEDYDKYYSGFGLKSTVEQLARFGVCADEYEIMVGNTSELAKEFDKAHYVFLDADHSYAGVSKDLEAWWPRIPKGGYMGGHDWEFSTVSAAVKNMFSGVSIQVVEKECWLVKKD